MVQQQANNKKIAYWLFGMSGLVAGMVTVGGITRLTKSGLSMTDWNVQVYSVHLESKFKPVIHKSASILLILLARVLSHLVHRSSGRLSSPATRRSPSGSSARE